ncbi:MAG: ComEC/Rec2 family competence protein [Arcanobacterium sp.]|nr:ComEC/Rec2 family competence protein [Arcanobacterium sp.]
MHLDARLVPAAAAIWIVTATSEVNWRWWLIAAGALAGCSGVLRYLPLRQPRAAMKSPQRKYWVHRQIRECWWARSTLRVGCASQFMAIAVSVVTACAARELHQHFGNESAEFQRLCDAAIADSHTLIGSIAARQRAALASAAAALAPQLRGLVLGVVIGDDSAMPHTAVEQLRMLGLSHVTAVSGAHVSLVLGVVIYACGKRWPRVTAALAAVALWWLVHLVGPEASVLRAVMMGILIVVAIAAQRRASALPCVCIAVMVACVCFPRLATSLGFQLSASTTAAIVLVGYPISAQFARIVPPALAQAVALPLVAGLASVPFVAGIQRESSLWAVCANAAVAPVIAPLTLCGLAAVLVLPVAAPVAHILLQVCAGSAWWIMAVSEALARAPGSHVGVWTAAGVNAAALCALLAGARWRAGTSEQSGVEIRRVGAEARLRMRVWRKRRAEARERRRMKARERRQAEIWARRVEDRQGISFRYINSEESGRRWRLVSRRHRALAAAGALLLVGIFAMLGQLRGMAFWERYLPWHAEQITNDWEVVQCDVGQGAALLARHGSETVLIDVGPQAGRIDRCLRAAQVKQISLLVLSHFDSDHVRGLAAVLRIAHIEAVWVSPNAHPEANSRWVLRLLEQAKVPVRQVEAGAHFHSWLTVESPEHPACGDADSNRDSLVIRLRTQHYSILNLADTPADVQDRLALRAQRATIVVVAHHGSASQSAQLAAAVRPAVALISVGKNTYGHPTKQALTIWATPLMAITDSCGWVSIRPAGVETERRCNLVAK